jgi:chromosome segregation ATPase
MPFLSAQWFVSGVGTQLPAALGLHGSNNSFNSDNISHSSNPSNSTGFYNHVPKIIMECTAIIQQASNSIRASNSSLSAKDVEIDKLKKALND